MSLDRRGFFQVSLWGATGLVLSFYTGAELFADQTQAEQPKPETFKANAWIRIEGEGRIVFTLDRSEMGQGVYPSFALLVAEELEIDPEQLIVEFAPAAREYGNPKIINLQVTGGSTSLTGSYESLRMAGASLREVLRQAAAKRWQVELATCHAEAGAIHHKASARSLSYASLAVDAAKLPLPTHLELKKPKDFRLIGKARLRSDALLKVTGQAQFGIDATIPDLRIAVYLRSPVFGARLKSYQAQGARKVPGVEDIIAVDDGLAIVAQRYWQARKAAELIVIEWDTGTDKKLQSETIFANFTEQAKAQIAANASKDELGPDEHLIQAEYQLPYLAHATMEPMNCTVRLTDDRCEVWAATQGPALAQELAARISGLDAAQVTIHSCFLGGGFGRRLVQDFVGQAVAIAKAVKKPIKLIWSREEDMQHDFYRPANAHSLKLTMNAEGRIRSWQHVIVGPSIQSEILPDWIRAKLPFWMPDFMKGAAGATVGSLIRLSGQDPTGTEGASDSAYEWGETDVSFHRIDPGIPVGFWRSVGHSYTGFVVETMMDELAHKKGVDPFKFRLLHLTKSPRHQAVLAELRTRAGWDQALPTGLFRGMAIHQSFGTVCAQAVELRVDAARSAIKLHRVVAVVDCGQVVQPNIVEAQVSGAIVFALSAALYGKISIKDGQVEQSNFHDYPPLRLSECPPIEVYMMPSEAAPSGIGEPGVPPLAPALANALFAATGQRLRSLPLQLAAPA